MKNIVEKIFHKHSSRL